MVSYAVYRDVYLGFSGNFDGDVQSGKNQSFPVEKTAILGGFKDRRYRCA
jgi:hypothetical protein